MELDQWQKGYPSREIWENDIKSQQAWVAIEGNLVLGAFAFQTAPDPYASMHRVCVADTAKGKGVAGKMFAFGFEMARQLGFNSLRIDTHPGNLPMQRALSKSGFVYCGEIILKGGAEDGDLRAAFEKLLI